MIIFIATFSLIEVELRPAAGPAHPGHASAETVLALFVLFGAATFWTRWYFERRAKEKMLTSVASETDESG